MVRSCHGECYPFLGGTSHARVDQLRGFVRGRALRNPGDQAPPDDSPQHTQGLLEAPNSQCQDGHRIRGEEVR